MKSGLPFHRVHFTRISLATQSMMTNLYFSSRKTTLEAFKRACHQSRKVFFINELGESVVLWNCRSAIFTGRDAEVFGHQVSEC